MESLWVVFAPVHLASNTRATQTSVWLESPEVSFYFPACEIGSLFLEGYYHSGQESASRCPQHTSFLLLTQLAFHDFTQIPLEGGIHHRHTVFCTTSPQPRLGRPPR